jgi:predicted DNA-binding transcriptional regulator YafY
MFSQDEAKALVAAVRLSQPWLDAPLALAAEDALGKMLSILPAAARAAAESLALYAPPASYNGLTAPVRADLQLLREAIGLRRKVQMDYCDAKEAVSQRTVQPLGCFYWGRTWTLVAWCEARHDFRSFRIDRMQAVAVLELPFRSEAGRSLADFLRKLAC